MRTTFPPFPIPTFVPDYSNYDLDEQSIDWNEVYMNASPNFTLTSVLRSLLLHLIIIITTTIFIVLSSMVPAIRESSLRFIWAKVGQRQVAANSQAKLQT